MVDNDLVRSLEASLEIPLISYEDQAQARIDALISGVEQGDLPQSRDRLVAAALDLHCYICLCNTDVWESDTIRLRQRDKVAGPPLKSAPWSSAAREWSNAALLFADGKDPDSLGLEFDLDPTAVVKSVELMLGDSPIAEWFGVRIGGFSKSVQDAIRQKSRRGVIRSRRSRSGERNASIYCVADLATHAEGNRPLLGVLEEVVHRHERRVREALHQSLSPVALPRALRALGTLVAASRAEFDQE